MPPLAESRAPGVGGIFLRMEGIALGAASFCVIFWVDVLSLKGMRAVQPIVWISSTALFAAGLVLCLEHPGSLSLPVPVRALGWALTIAFGLLLIYSLFVEIPLFQAPSKVVSRGTYALCRHPGVLWFSAMLAALFLARGSTWLLLAAPVWISLDVLYAVLPGETFLRPPVRRGVPFVSAGSPNVPPDLPKRARMRSDDLSRRKLGRNEREEVNADGNVAGDASPRRQGGNLETLLRVSGAHRGGVQRHPGAASGRAAWEVEDQRAREEDPG